MHILTAKIKEFMHVCLFVCVHPETAKLSCPEAAEVEADSANNSQHSSEEQSKLTMAFFYHTGRDTDAWEWTPTKTTFNNKHADVF